MAAFQPRQRHRDGGRSLRCLFRQPGLARVDRVNSVQYGIPHASENNKYRDQIRSSAGIAVFVGDRADPEHWIKVGRNFQRFALQATVLGIRTAHVNQPIGVPSVRPEFARWLGTPDARPDLVIRFGRAPAMPMSLRRPVSAVRA